jgi:hypothetical protein
LAVDLIGHVAVGVGVLRVVLGVTQILYAQIPGRRSGYILENHIIAAALVGI